MERRGGGGEQGGEGDGEREVETRHSASLTDRSDCSLEAGVIVKPSGTERTLASGVHFLEGLSEEWE